MRPVLMSLAVLGLITSSSLHAADPPAVADAVVAADGPYALRDATGVHALWVCAGKVQQRELKARRDSSVRLPVVCGYPHAIDVLPPAPIAADVLPMPTRVAALSDIHGQYGVMRQLLRANRIIDSKDRWRFGSGSLVVAGDVFDRGPQVTEAFWLLYALQQQAKAAGGAVHFVLGNHETMVLYNDLRYVNPKYIAVANQLGQPYPALYGADSVIGQWLRTRPEMLKLGDTLFLHGGIAPENLELVTQIASTNANYRASLGTPKAEVKANPVTARLYDGKTSPIWYRGYFNGALTTEQVKALVAQLGLARIVVGHTTIGEVASFHDGKIIAIDSAIKRGKSGQLLFIEDGKLSRGLMDGSRQALPALTAIPDDPD